MNRYLRPQRLAFSKTFNDGDLFRLRLKEGVSETIFIFSERGRMQSFTTFNGKIVNAVIHVGEFTDSNQIEKSNHWDDETIRELGL